MTLPCFKGRFNPELTLAHSPGGSPPFERNTLKLIGKACDEVDTEQIPAQSAS